MDDHGGPYRAALHTAVGEEPPGFLQLLTPCVNSKSDSGVLCCVVLCCVVLCFVVLHVTMLYSPNITKPSTALYRVTLLTHSVSSSAAISKPNRREPTPDCIES